MVRICERCLNPDINVLELEVFGSRFPNNRSILDDVVKPRLVFTMNTEEDANKGIQIDWGDGNKTDYQPSLGKEYRFGNNNQWDSTFYEHEFPDGEEKWRTIKIKFNGGLDKLTRYYSEWLCYRGELHSTLSRSVNLETLYLYSCRGTNIEKYNDENFNEEGFDKIPPTILNLVNLKSFTCHFAWKIGSSLNEKIPLEFFNTSLVNLTYGGGVSVDFTNKEINNFDKLPLLKTTLLNFSSNYSNLNIESFPDNWGSLNIEFMSFLGFNGTNSNISKLLLDSIKYFTIQSRSIGEITSGEWLDIPENSKLEKMTVWTFSYTGLNDPSKLPKNLERAVKLKYLTFGHPTTSICLLSTTEQVTEWWSSWYPFIVANASMDEYAPDQKFRGITFDFRGGIVDTPIEAPNGYIQGSSNGTPTTLGQQIFVLSNQYDHVNSYTTQL